MDGFWAVWIALGGNAVFIAVVAFLGRNVVTHWLDKDIERFKSDIRATADTELAKLRSALQIVANEHSILLTRLQDKRAEVIDQLYGLLATSISTTRTYVAIFEFPGDPSREEKGKRAAEAIVAFTNYFDQKRIWLPVECCSKVEALETGLRNIFNEFTLDRSFEKRGQPKAQEWIKIWENVTKDLVPPARATLETEMRRLLEPRRTG
jgi:hypothetical protein